MRYDTPTIVALDIDGIINPSPIAKMAVNGYVSRLLAQMPTFKKAALGMIEIGEVLLNAGNKKTNRMDIVRRNWDAPYLGIITDRSRRGLATALRGNHHILQWMSFIQVRQSIWSGADKLKYGPELWQTKSVKPDESVLYRLAEFAKDKGVAPHEVLVVDDDPEFRFIAKSRFGFRVHPDDTVDEELEEFYIPLHRAITPTL